MEGPRMDFRGKRYERGSNWSDPEVLELLQLWADESVQLELESCLRNQHVFNRIAEVLRAKGILRTGDQCREKIKKMKLEYRRMKESHRTLRRGRAWKFYEVMDRVLANRPSVSYSSLGGAVIAHQVLQGAGAAASDAFRVHSLPPGGFLFGPAAKQADLLEIKSEDVESEDGLMGCDPPSVSAPPPQLLYHVGSEDDEEGGDEEDDDEEGGENNNEEARGAARLEQGDMGRGQRPPNVGFSPSGASDQNMASSSVTGWSTASGPQAGGEDEGGVGDRRDGGGPGPHGQPRPRKRRRQGRGGGGGCRGRGALDEALARFLGWQREAEERLLALEEARLEREAAAEERRERLEERRAELDRQHELRLFTLFTGVLGASRRGGSADPEAPCCATERLAQSNFLSRRGNGILQHRGILQEGYNLCHEDKYDASANPSGIINMGTSENKLCDDLMSKRLMQADMLHVEPALLQYPDWKGHRFLREEVARFLSHYCKSPMPLQADNVVVMNGCGSLFSCIAAVLCDPGDGMLIPTPFYGAITEDVQLYSGVRLVHAPLDCQPGDAGGRPFQLRVEKLQEALEEATREGVTVRAVIVLNPHNPLGEIYSPQEVTDVLEFAKRHGLHAIVDEVYMLTVFDPSAEFRSVLGLSRLPDAQRTHVLWGISKDFAAAGMRVGTVYSHNKDLVAALDQMGFLHGVPGPTQHQVARLLRDREWMDRHFLPANLARLRAAHGYVAGELRDLGVPYLHRPAGFFIWADFRKYLPENTFQAEMALWRCFLKHKVLLSCGRAFWCSTPGWFRIVFSEREPSLRLGMERIKKALEEQKRLLRPLPEEHARTETGDFDMDIAGDQGTEESAAEKKASGRGAEQQGQDLGVNPLGPEERRLPDVQSAQPSVKLDALIGTLRQQIRSSDWLEKNTPELSPGEDPELFDVFADLLSRARKQ
ncbi:1-aminocyclopropane-1-carboxylate synthase-like protein 1 isoform X2 [Scleropages formosus]|uniref:1-aminocyclopropane-1-carboxylate synthase-like protein 1 n=1 Tax=Scleropages formosus TaxID=113540 RepID=A0A8C9WIR3_SCLFO|nr:1-aminocyclopropane-1-carboxylate synthase-like protein 1 isoform X2 [Scleropages formosus]